MSNNNDSYSYVNYLLAEHRRLHRVLLDVRRAIATCREANQIDWKRDVVKALRELRVELQCHFAQEEEGGCLDEAVSFQPRLSPEMTQIEQEHPRLLAAVDRLIAMAQDCQVTPTDALVLETDFDKLYHQLQAHEAAENDILRKAFGAAVDSDDNGVANTPIDS